MDKASDPANNTPTAQPIATPSAPHASVPGHPDAVRSTSIQDPPDAERQKPRTVVTPTGAKRDK